MPLSTYKLRSLTHGRSSWYHSLSADTTKLHCQDSQSGLKTSRCFSCCAQPCRPDRAIGKSHQAIQSNDALDPNGDPLNAILQSCAGDLSTFQTRLQKLARGVDGGAIRKSWRAVVAVVQEKEFQQATRKIEAYKSTLQSHLQNQDLFATALALKVGRSKLM